MKKIIFHTLLFSLCAFLFGGCYEDKGDYDYHFDNLNSIDSLVFSPNVFSSVQGNTIELQQPIGTDSVGRVSVRVVQSFRTDDELLEYTWIVSGDDGVDTLHTKGYVDLPLKADQTTSYRVMLSVRDTKSTLAHYARVFVTTRPIFKNSLFVLHGTGIGQMRLGNVETVSGEVKVRPDAWSVAHAGSDNPFSRAVGLTYGAYYDPSLGESQNLAVFSADGTAGIYNPFGLMQKYAPTYVLAPSDQPFVFAKGCAVGDATVGADYKFIISRDGQLRVARTYLCYHQPGANTTDPLHVGTDYKIDAGTIAAETFVFWDSKNNRFLYLDKGDYYGWSEATAREQGQLTNPLLDAKVDLSGFSSSLSPIGKTAVYAWINHTESYNSAHAFFLFKGSRATDWYLCELTPRSRKDVGYIPGDPAFVAAMKRLNGFNPGSNTNSITYNTLFSTNYLFYANGDAVYRYNTSNSEVTTIYTAPPGWNVSCIKFRTTDPHVFSGDLGRWLSIGLTRNGEGAVAEMLLTTAGDADESVAPTFYSGFSPVVDVQFAPVYYYENPNSINQ